MISRRLYFWSALALATLLFLGVNIFANNFFTNTRIDLTQSRQYTLSPGTRAILSKLTEPVTLRFYFSRQNSADYPVTAAYARRVRDLLGQYASIAKGKIILEDVDPEAFTPEEDQANAAGLKPTPAANGAGAVFFGLEGANSIDDKTAIPYFNAEREPYLEYDLTALIYQLSHPGKPKLAILSSLPLTNSPTAPGQPMAIFAQLQRDYDVTVLTPDFAAIPPGTQLLIIAHPQDVGILQLRQIEMFVLHGGRAMLFVDPLSELVQQQHTQGAKPSSDFKVLLQGWGVNYSPLQVVLDRELAQRVTDPNDPRRPSVPYPMWLHLGPANFAKGDPATASLQGVNVASAGALTRTKDATTRFEPLLLSSGQASLFPRDQALQVTNPAMLSDAVNPTGKPFTIAARITGKAVFPGVAEGIVNIVVVADTDILDDKWWLGRDAQGGGAPFADNGGFVLNAVENLTGSDDLISLRMRANTDRPFVRVRAMQADADRKFRELLGGLQARLTASEQEFAQLQQGMGGTATSLTPEQTAQMDRVRRVITNTRSELRGAQGRLRSDIDRLGAMLAFINVLLMPILVAIFAIAFSMVRRRRAKAGLA